MAGQICGKCGEVIKSGQKIVYEEGKPMHYECSERLSSRSVSTIERERFEESLSWMIESLDKIVSECEYWSERLEKLPPLPLDKSIFVAYARVGLAGIIKDAKEQSRILKEIRTDLWRYAEEL